MGSFLNRYRVSVWGGAEKLLEAGNGNGYTTLNVTNAFESYT